MSEDFGFSAVDDIPTETVKEQESLDLTTIEAKLEAIIIRLDAIEVGMGEGKDIELDDYYKSRLKEIEELVVPMLEGLAQNSEKAYIHWPNRKPLLEDKIKQIKKLTRYT